MIRLPTKMTSYIPRSTQAFDNALLCSERTPLWSFRFLRSQIRSSDMRKATRVIVYCKLGSHTQRKRGLGTVPGGGKRQSTPPCRKVEVPRNDPTTLRSSQRLQRGERRGWETVGTLEKCPAGSTSYRTRPTGFLAFPCSGHTVEQHIQPCYKLATHS